MLPVYWPSHAGNEARRAISDQSGAQPAAAQAGAEPADLDGHRDLFDTGPPPSLLFFVAFELYNDHRGLLADRA